MLDSEYMLRGWLTLCCSTWLGTTGMHRWFWLLICMHGAWSWMFVMCLSVFGWPFMQRLAGDHKYAPIVLVGWIHMHAKYQLRLCDSWHLFNIGFHFLPICSHIPNSLVETEFWAYRGATSHEVPSQWVTWSPNPESSFRRPLFPY